MDKSRELLEKQLVQELETMHATISLEGESRGAVTDQIVKLYELKIAEDSKTQELQFKKEELEETKKSKTLDTILSASGIVLQLLFYGMWMKRGFRFEQTGSFTSQTFKGLIAKFKPFK